MDKFIELDWLKRWAGIAPKSIALQCADTGRSFSYRELFERSAHLGAVLREKYKISAGERVAILAMNEPEHLFLFFALQRIGAVLVPVNFRLTAREIDHILKDSAPKLFIYQEAYAEVFHKLKECPAQVMPFQGKGSLQEVLQQEVEEILPMAADWEKPCMILYTSGTTGSPKGAMITPKMLFWNSVNTALRLNITQNDAAIIFHPFFHTSGWNVLTTPFLHHGARIVLLKKFEAERVLQLAESEKVTILFGVPTMMDMMARTKVFTEVKLPSVRYAIVGGEPMPIEGIQTWAKKNIPIRQGFGLTEFGPNVFSLNEEDAIRKMGSIGFPNFYVDVKVQDEKGQEIKNPHVVGELLLRGPMCTLGYWNNEKATKEAIQENWFHTGDLVRFDEEGYFYVAGRKKDMYISGGENVYPAEVEQYLRSHPKMHEVAVVGVSDERWGEVGKAFYSSLDGQEIPASELYEYCLKALAKYKIPKSFVHLKELPKGASGKIQKRDL